MRHEAGLRRLVLPALRQAQVVVVRDRAKETAPPPPLTPEKLPDPVPDGLRVLVETLFKPGEGIAIGAGFKGADGNLVIDRGVVRTWDRWQVALQKRPLEQMNHAGNELFLRINPMSRGGLSVASVRITR